MKKIFILVMAAAVCGAVQTAKAIGPLDLGIKAGITTQNFNFDDVNSHNIYQVARDNVTGYHVGAVARFNLAIFHIQPEVLYTRTGYNLETMQVVNHSEGKSKIRLNSVDMPVLFGLRLLWFRFQAGPAFNLLTDNSIKGDGAWDVDVNKPFISYMLGVGFDIGKINLDVRYNGQFSRTKHHVQFTDDMQSHTYKSHMNSWQFSVGYLF